MKKISLGKTPAWDTWGPRDTLYLPMQGDPGLNLDVFSNDWDDPAFDLTDEDFVTGDFYD